MWLTGRLVPDHKTIADFRKDNGQTETGPVTMPNYGAFRFTRVGGPTPDAPDVYSPVKNGWVSPGRFDDSGHPIWPRLPIPTGQDYAEAASYGEKDRKSVV